MSEALVLASGSAIRRQLLERAGVPVSVVPARIDEEALRDGLLAEGAAPHDVADALAEAKAMRVAGKHPRSLVLGCDQVLGFKGHVFGKPTSPEDARDQLMRLRGQTHALYSAAVIYEEARPVWRHVGHVRLTMRAFSDAYLDDYLTRNWDSVRESVGAYKLEEEGVRLFAQVQGDYFSVLGLPLIELLSYLAQRGTVPA